MIPIVYCVLDTELISIYRQPLTFESSEVCAFVSLYRGQ